MNIPSEPGSPPAVSVIMPAYRTTAYIAEALDSVLAQTFRDFEIIVVNDECPDTVNLDRVLAPYLSSIKYLKQQHGGPGAARNTAIRAARASLVAFLDSDDAWEPHYLATQVGIMSASPEIDLLYPNATIFGDTPHAGRVYTDLFPSKGDVTLRSVLERRCWIFYSLIARRETLVRAGLYNPALVNGEDLDLWLRILNQGGRIAYHAKPLVRYRGRPGSITRDELSAHQQLVALLRQVGGVLDLNDADRHCLERAITRETAWLHHIVGKQAFFEGDTETAYDNLLQANRHFQSAKTALVLFLMKHAPRLLQWAARRRYSELAITRR